MKILQREVEDSTGSRIERWVQRYRQGGATAFEKSIGRSKKGNQSEIEVLEFWQVSSG